MCLDINDLHIVDDLPDLGEYALEEEITILAPYLLNGVLGEFGADGDGERNKSSPLCEGEHGETG